MQEPEFKIALLPIDALKPHEKGSPLYLRLLEQEILQDGVLKYPIIVDKESKVILDGMHRWLALKKLGCKLIPVLLVDAVHDRRIHIGKRRIHRYIGTENGGMTVKDVILTGLSGHLMKPRTTRHFFPFSKPPRINHPIDSLGKSTPKEASKYLGESTRAECQIAIDEWFREISEELEFLEKRKEEVEKERAEFLNRIRSLGDSLSAS